jgi:hypothetical protein
VRKGGETLNDASEENWAEQSMTDNTETKEEEGEKGEQDSGQLTFMGEGNEGKVVGMEQGRHNEEADRVVMISLDNPEMSQGFLIPDMGTGMAKQGPMVMDNSNGTTAEDRKNRGLEICSNLRTGKEKEDEDAWLNTLSNGEEEHSVEGPRENRNRKALARRKQKKNNIKCWL